MATNKLTSKQIRDIFIAELNAQGITGDNQAAILGQVKKEMQFLTKYLIEGISDSAAEEKYGLSQTKKAKELGNSAAGDGAKYKGRGFIQLTGRNNYKQVGQALYADGVIDDPDLFVNNPDVLRTDPSLAAKASVKFLTIDPRFKSALTKPTLKEKVNTLTKIINPGLFSNPNKKHDGGMTYQEDIDLRIKNAENFSKQIELNNNGFKVGVDGIIDKGGETEKSWEKFKQGSTVPTQVEDFGGLVNAKPEALPSPNEKPMEFPNNKATLPLGLEASDTSAIKSLQKSIGVKQDGDWGPKSQTAYDMMFNGRNQFAQTDPRRVDLPETGGTIPVREYAQEMRSQPRTEALNPIRNYAAEDMTQQGMGRARIVEPIRPLERTYDFNTMEDLLMSKGLMPNPLL
jgi:hypothetical protein